MGAKVVWVLGAGFSKPLGGPMLADLLSLESRRDILEQHPTKDDPGVYWLYHYGRKFPDGFLKDRGESYSPTIRGENLWEHAEDYLDKLDTAAHSPAGPLAARLIRILENWKSGASPPQGAYPNGLNEGQKRLAFVAEMARRYVAAECVNFTNKTTEEAEQWRPYREWVRSLAKDDVLLTFNYDTVIERADKRDRVVVVRSDRDWDKAERDLAPCLLKLHGSVNWKWDGKSLVEASNNFAESANASEIVIATPGFSKQAAVAKQLGTLWQLAQLALKLARAVIFIGYRFPPTDAQARQELLGAIRENTEAHLDLHTVLGPRQDSDTLRLGALLRSSCPITRSYSMTQHPLWCEDFLTVWERKRLFMAE